MDFVKIMRRLGMSVREISAEEVIIRSGEEIVIKNPKVSALEYGGGKIYIVIGEEFKISEDDVKIIMERTGKSREEVLKALRESKGDLIKAIEILGG